MMSNQPMPPPTKPIPAVVAVTLQDGTHATFAAPTLAEATKIAHDALLAGMRAKLDQTKGDSH
jgi:hypothetical protein